MNYLQLKPILLLKLGIVLGCSVHASTENVSVLDTLPTAAQAALSRWNFKFKPFTEADYTPEVRDLFKNSQPSEKPMLLVLDLNGDKIDDYVLIGEADKQQYVVALVSDEKNFKPVVVEQWSDPNFKQSSIPGGQNRKGVPYYLVIPADDDKVAIDFRKKMNSNIFAVEAYLGVTKDFAIKNFKPVKLNK